jgi:hypothetical protein
MYKGNSRDSGTRFSLDVSDLQDELEPPPQYGVTGLFSSTLGALSEFKDPVDLKL